MRGRALAWAGGVAVVLAAAGLATYVAVVGLGGANELAGVAGVFVGLAGVGVAVYGVIRAHQDAVGSGTAGEGLFAGNVAESRERARERSTETPARGSRRIVGVLPAEADCFQHRSLIDAVHEAVAAGETAVLGQVLAGMGGVGKTQLAARYARNAWEAAAIELLVWVSAPSREAIVAAYARAGTEVTGADASDPQAAAQRFLAFLQASSRRWLMVLDDLADPADLRDLWPPRSPGGQILVTTRRRDAALTGQGRRLVDVGLFTPAEAAAYLSANLAAHGRSDDPVQIAGLADDLGHLPLALAQAAAFIVDADMECAGYRRKLADSRYRLSDLVPDSSGLPDDHRATIAAAWAMSVGHADRLPPTGLARPMLELAAMLDPNGIPAGVLDSAPSLAYLAANRGYDAGAGATAVEAGDAARTLHSLRRLSLLELGTDTPARAVAVHSLIQRATREQMPSARRDQAARATADALVDCWPAVEREAAVAQALRDNAAVLARVSGQALWQQEAHEILARAGSSLAEAGMVSAAVAYYEELKARAEQNLGPRHPDTLNIRNSLAGWRGVAGDTAGAIASLEEVLADQAFTLGKDHHDTLSSRADLASWRGQAGDPAGAVVALEELLPDCVRVLGAENAETLIVRNNIADMRARAGDPAGAVTAFEELLADQTRLLGPDHRDTLRTRMSLATHHGSTGDPADAADALDRVVADYVRVVGPDHPDTLLARNNAASMRGRAGDPGSAAAAFEELLTDRIRILGPDHPYTLATRMNIADSLGKAGNPTSALGRFEELLPDYQRVLGSNHVETLTARERLAEWLWRTGDLAGAAAAYEQLLLDSLRLVSADHPLIGIMRIGLAHARSAAGDVAGALTAFDELLADLQRLLGPQHADTLMARHYKADCQGEAGDLAGAVAALEALLADSQRILGLDHPDTKETRECLAGWQQQHANETARRTDIVRIEIGSELLPFADPEQGGQLIAEIGRIRDELAAQPPGWLLPPVRIVDTTETGGREYRIYIRGEIVMQSHAPTDWAVLISGSDAVAAPVGITGEPGFLPQRVRWLTGAQATTIPETSMLSPSAIIAGNLRHLAREHRFSLENGQLCQSSNAPSHHDLPHSKHGNDVRTQKPTAEI